MRKRNVRGICAFLCTILLGCLIPAGEVQAQRALDVARERGYQLEERYQPAGSIITEINTGQILWQENACLLYTSIEDLPEDETISFYSQGEFTDLCAGPHLMSTKYVKAFKLTSLAGAYWRGSEKNKMLQRIYGTAFPKKAELEEYLNMLEEAKKRDHRKLGKELGLFMMRDEGPGFPFFLPNGMVLDVYKRQVYDNPVVHKIEKDFQETLKKSCKVTASDIGNTGIFMRICGRVLRLIAPLM